jgi:hypothetical protein
MEVLAVLLKEMELDSKVELQRSQVDELSRLRRHELLIHHDFATILAKSAFMV